MSCDSCPRDLLARQLLNGKFGDSFFFFFVKGLLFLSLFFFSFEKSSKILVFFASIYIYIYSILFWLKKFIKKIHIWIYNDMIKDLFLKKLLKKFVIISEWDYNMKFIN